MPSRFKLFIFMVITALTVLTLILSSCGFVVSDIGDDEDDKGVDSSITSTSLDSCPILFDDTSFIYTISSGLIIKSSCTVTFGPHIRVNIKGIIRVEDGATLIIREGALLAFDENSYISVGGNGNGTLKALGTEDDSIRFVNLTSGTQWGTKTTMSSAGGLLFNDAATAACSLYYCVIDSASTGVTVKNAELTISNSRISNCLYYGCNFQDGGTPLDSAHFTNNIITGNGEYGISIFANFVGNLSGTGSIAGNNSGAILINGDNVELDAVWKKHDAPYIIDGKITVGSANGITVTITPGCVFEFKESAHISIGANESGTVIANGTESDSIRFTNYTQGTNWGYKGTVNASGGILINDAATDECSFTYCTIDSASSGIKISDASITIAHCRIGGNKYYGISLNEGGSFLDSSAFVDNVITGNGKYGVWIFANHLGTLSGTGSFSDNTEGAILVSGNSVTMDAVWKKHDAPYIIDGIIAIGGANGATVTIRPGCVFALKESAYISIGAGATGTIIANGTKSDSIRFTNYTQGTNWGYKGTVNASGGILINNAATDECSFTYCTIDSASSGIRISDASITIAHCSIGGNKYYGISLNEGGSFLDSSAFVDNVITGNGKYGVWIFANHLGTLSGTGSFSDNTEGAILVSGNSVTMDAVWKKHDLPYIVDGKIAIGSTNGVTVTIRPGASFKFMERSYITIGEMAEGTLIANGTKTDSISFSNSSSGFKWGSNSTQTSAGGIWIGDKSTDNTSLSYCSITEATTGIYIKVSEPTIKNCFISDCGYYGIYLNNTSETNISDNTVTGNSIGDIISN